MKILGGLVLDPSKIGCEECITHRVFKRGDKEKKPILYVYANIPGQGKYFFIGDREKERFIRNGAR